MAKILQLKARQILDSRGNPTVECDCWIEGHILGRASVPSGASTGIHEAVELRDKDEKKYLGRGVLTAVGNINTKIHADLKGIPVTGQKVIDERLIQLDGTENKSRLGANAILAVSLACAKAAAILRRKPLYQYIKELFGPVTLSMPVPMMNILNGGEHADNNLDIQEFMIAPTGAATFSEALRMGAEVFHRLKNILKAKGLGTTVGDEGGFAPNLKANNEALDLLMEAIQKAGFEPRKDMWIAIDAAASSFYKEGKYRFDGGEKTTDEMIAWYKEMIRIYPIYSIEDGLQEEDWEGWQKMTKMIGERMQLVGDDLFATHCRRLQTGVEKKAANAILIKLNQIGTLTETLNAIRLAKEAGFGTIISHRSGETEDSTIADLAVATGAGQIKTGSLSRTDRLAKYNQLLRIEEDVGSQVPYFGQHFKVLHKASANKIS